MDKPKFRYNHKTGKWDELFKINTDVAFVSGIRRPDGSFNTYTLPMDSPLTEFLIRNPGLA